MQVNIMFMLTSCEIVSDICVAAWLISSLGENSSTGPRQRRQSFPNLKWK